MPRMLMHNNRKLGPNDSITSIGFYDGEVTKTELVGETDLRVTVGDEDFLIDKEHGEKHDMHTRKHIKGFLVEYCVPDDGCTVFTFRNFVPMK